MSTSKAWIIGAAIGVAALLGGAGWLAAARGGLGGDAGGARADGASGVVPVQVEPVLRGDFDVERRFVGTLEPAATFEVSARVSARVEEVLVQLADPVKRGAVVVRLDDEELRQSQAAARAEHAVARAQVEAALAAQSAARQAYDRVKSLHARGVVSAEEWERVQADRQQSDAALAVARARVAQAGARANAEQVRAGYAEVRASWPGEGETRLVGTRHVDEGQTVAPGDPLITVVDIDPLVAVLFVTEAEYADLAPGQRVELRSEAWPGERFEGQIGRVAPVFDPGSRQARVEVQVPNPDRRLRPGMFVRLVATVATLEEVTTVPADALVEDDEGSAVYLLDEALEDGVASVRRVPVQPGVRVGSRLVVRGEGVEGRVVVLGQHLLRDGAAVRVVGALAVGDGGPGVESPEGEAT